MTKLTPPAASSHFIHLLTVMSLLLSQSISFIRLSSGWVSVVSWADEFVKEKELIAWSDEIKLLTLIVDEFLCNFHEKPPVPLKSKNLVNRLPCLCNNVTITSMNKVATDMIIPRERLYKNNSGSSLVSQSSCPFCRPILWDKQFNRASEQ